MGGTNNRASRNIRCIILFSDRWWRSRQCISKGRLRLPRFPGTFDRRLIYGSCGCWWHHIVVESPTWWCTSGVDLFHDNRLWNLDARLSLRVINGLAIPRCWCPLPHRLVAFKEGQLFGVVLLYTFIKHSALPALIA